MRFSHEDWISLKGEGQGGTEIRDVVARWSVKIRQIPAIILSMITECHAVRQIRRASVEKVDRRVRACPFDRVAAMLDNITEMRRQDDIFAQMIVGDPLRLVIEMDDPAGTIRLVLRVGQGRDGKGLDGVGGAVRREPCQDSETDPSWKNAKCATHRRSTVSNH